MTDRKITNILLETNTITRGELIKALELRENDSDSVIDILIGLEIIDESILLRKLSLYLKVPFVELDKEHIDSSVSLLMSEETARRKKAIPYRLEGTRLLVAVCDPLNIIVLDEIKLITRCNIIPILALERHILSTIDKIYGDQNTKNAAEEFNTDYEQQEETINIEDPDTISASPVVKLINATLRQAVKNRASDIHIEPYKDRVRIRFRIDGVLREVHNLDKSVHAGVMTRIKILSGLNIAEKRLPQDGRVEICIDKNMIDLRIAVMPTIFGEKAAIRILDTSQFCFTRENLGFTMENLMKYNRIIRKPQGIILVTGPTGSGKSTTLYSILHELNKPGCNIITVEDPVEYRIEGINQTQVGSGSILSFPNLLRFMLRQDPDIIMVGEIRDSETAEIAFSAASTGHLVLSTIHTNDTVSSINRFLEMGIKNYLISSCLSGVIAQRLVKQICNNCKFEYPPSDSEQKLLKMKPSAKLYKGAGCVICNNTGYFGRLAIHEIMVVDKNLRKMIDSQTPVEDIRAALIKNGMHTLRDNAVKAVLDGKTTIDEMYRVSYSIDVDI